jgi:hypothetical protein
MRTSIVISLALVFAAVGSACTTEEDLAAQGDVAGEDPALDGPDGGKEDSATTLPLRFLDREVFVPSASIRNEVRKVFRSAAELKATLGMDNPGIDFSREWAVFYTPGMSRTDLLPGYLARIDTVKLSSTGLTLMATTSLEQNGNCASRRSRPFLLVAIPKPATPPPYTRFTRADRTRSCPTDVTYLDGVAFTAAQAAASLRAANLATAAQLTGAGITGSPAALVTGGRPWASLAAVAATSGIGVTTMTRLRDLGAGF